MNKWTDLQLSATYEGPEAVQRRQLSITMASELFLERFRFQAKQVRTMGGKLPGGAGAELLAAAMEMWIWGMNYLGDASDPAGNKLYHGARHGVTFPFADALCWLLASRAQIEDVLELAEKGGANPAVAEGLEGNVAFFSDLAHVQAARAAGEVGRILAELVHGYRAPGAPEPAGLKEFAVMRGRVDGLLAGAKLAKDRAGHALSKVMIPEALGYPV